MADAVLGAYSPPDPKPQLSTRLPVGDPDISIDEGHVVTTQPEPPGAIFAQADSEATANVLGIAVSAGERQGYRNGHITVQWGGPVTLTEDQWDARMGTSGGLEPQTPYYLSPAFPGRITSTKPVGVGQYVVPIGWAISSTTLMLQIGIPVVIESP